MSVFDCLLYHRMVVEKVVNFDYGDLFDWIELNVRSRSHFGAPLALCR